MLGGGSPATVHAQRWLSSHSACKAQAALLWDRGEWLPRLCTLEEAVGPSPLSGLQFYRHLMHTGPNLAAAQYKGGMCKEGLVM